MIWKLPAGNNENTNPPCEVEITLLWNETIVSIGFSNTHGWWKEYYTELNVSNTNAPENWIQKAFNPFVVCNLPPMITSFSAEAHEEWGWISGWGGIPYWGVKACYITVSVVAKSVTGFSMVIIGARPLDKGEDTVVHVESIWSSTATVASYSNVRLDVDWWTLKVTGYRARAYAVSYAEDMSQAKSVEASHEIKGIVTLIADALANLWQMLVSGLQEVWNAVEKAVNAIVEWVKESIKSMMETVFAPAISALDNWKANLGNAFDDLSTSFFVTGDVPESIKMRVSDLLFGAFFNILLLVGTLILIIGYIITPFTVGIDTILGIVISFVSQLILTQILQGISSKGQTVSIPAFPTLRSVGEFIISLLGLSSNRLEPTAQKIAQNNSIQQPSIIDWLFWLLSWIAVTLSTVVSLWEKAELAPVIGFCIALIAAMMIFVTPFKSKKEMAQAQIILGILSLIICGLSVVDWFPESGKTIGLVKLTLGEKMLLIITSVLSIISIIYGVKAWFDA
ncbi:MAG: hypothetical protein QXU48_02190 [Thermoplasmata archaeon]